MNREQEQTREQRKLRTADVAAAVGEAQEKREEPRQKQAAVESQSKPIKLQDEQLAPLFSTADAQELRARWASIQTGFVDEPRRSVEQADELVAEVMRRLAETFSKERAELEGQWDQGDKVSTEELRLNLRRYRSFFERFLSL
jgi:hypothetical protein